MRYKCEIAYIGTRYAGFQSQINALAIQDVIEKSLEVIFKEKIRIIMASRTDAGVHALAQVFHFDAVKYDTYRLKGALNHFLPDDMHINKVEIANDNFHARFLVKAKTYRYIINTGESDPFLKDRALEVHYDLDLDKIEDCMKLFIGKHDFASFNTTPYSDVKDQVREIYDFKMIQKGKLLIFEIRGNGFLKNMVRLLIGALIDVGRNKKTIEDIKKSLAIPNKEKERLNVAPGGLYLVSIEY